MRIQTIIYLCLITLIACGKGGGGEEPPPPPSPAKTILQLPGNNEACATGRVVSATEAEIVLEWKAADNAESYDIQIKELESGIRQTKSTAQTHISVVLNRNKPYSWYVISKSSKTNTTAQSDIWKFYTEGPVGTSYSPFPAELLTPAYGNNFAAGTTKVNFSWKGADADNDIASYDLYLGTSTEPGLNKADINATVLNEVTVESGKTYYWKVVTKDTQGNKSYSDLYWFSVK